MNKITRKQHKGSYVTYAGFDGKDYLAQIADVKNGVVVIDYRVTSSAGYSEMVRAYVGKPFYSHLKFGINV